MNKIQYLLLLTIPSILHSFDRISYSFSHDPIDVVIPCHPDDTPTLSPLIKSIKKYVKDVRRIIVVSKNPLTNEAEWFDEALFPFTKKSLIEICKSKKITKSVHISKRIGWLYQQFLKFYAPLCIPNISSNVLVVDSDVLFLKPVHFLQENGAGLYATGTEYHRPYFQHAQRLLPELKRVYPQFSGIVHHMLFQKEVILDFFNLIEQRHGTDPWIAIAQTIAIDKNDRINNSAISEYEMYFNFIFSRTNQVKIRKLKWKNIRNNNEIAKCLRENYDFVAKHNRRKASY